MNDIRFYGLLIHLKYFRRERKVFQHFIWNKRDKYAKLLRDSRFILHNKFEENIKKNFNDTLEFIKRRDEDDRVVLEYNIPEDKVFDKKKDQYFRIVDFIPPNPGCEFCIYQENKDDIFFTCFLKQKTITEELKSCKYFKQRFLYI